MNRNIRFEVKFFLALLCLALAVNAFAQDKPSFDIPDDYSYKLDVTYSVVDGKEIKLDIYYKTEGKPLPLIIWIHGGAWKGGDKRSARFARELLGDGYAVASINYRLSQEAIFPAQIIDCKSAVRWLRAHAGQYNLNPYRFAAWGGSAGAHLAALVGTAEDKPEWERGDHLAYSSRVQAVVDWFGPTDFSRMNDLKGKMDHFAADSPESLLIGGAVPDHPEEVQNANPVKYVTKYSPPFQIYHGKDDELVIPVQAELLYEALTAHGHQPDFAILENTGHGGQEWNNYIPRAKAFLDKHLKQSDNRARPQLPREKRWVYTYMKIDPLLNYERFFSPAADSEYGYMIYYPPGYHENTSKRFPVIYWLPGKGGNPSGVTHFVNLYNEAIKNNEAPEAIIIGVNGVNSSMYTNERDGEWPIETVIMQDLIPHIDQTYRTMATRDMRAIDGFSMGGYGAARLGFKYIDTFGVISIIGAAIHKPEHLKELRPEIFETVFHNNMQYAEEQSPWTITKEQAKVLKKRSKRDTRIRQYVGQEDHMLLEKNKAFHQLLESLKIKHAHGIVTDAKHNYPQVYANWEGNPFEFYQDVFEKSKASKVK